MISEKTIHNNLVALTEHMPGGTPDVNSIHDDLTGIRELAGNELEGEIADVAQTLSFTTWIKDICDGVKQERELTVGSTEYNENTHRIKESISQVNHIGKQLGIKGDIIEMPQDGKETMQIADAIYKDYALPYEAGADVDYASYTRFKEKKNELSKAINKLSAVVAQKPQYGREAVGFWNAQTKAANHYNALAGEFLDEIDTLNMYQKEINEMAETGLKLSHDKTSKDFAGNDKSLSKGEMEYLDKANKLIKTERAMLQAGHIDTRRRTRFENSLKSIAQSIMKQTDEIKEDKSFDDAHDVIDRNITEYFDMVDQQKNEKPNLTIQDMNQCANVLNGHVKTMNSHLMHVGIIPMLTNDNVMDTIRFGKTIHDANHDMRPEMKHKTVEEPEKEIKQPETNKTFAQAVKAKADLFAEQMRTIVRENILKEEDEEFQDTVEHLIGDVIDSNGDVISAENEINTDPVSKISDVLEAGTGEKVFGKSAYDMTEDEKKICSTAVTAVMAPMRNDNGKCIENFADHYAVGEEDIPDAQKEYTDTMTDLMIIGQPETALTVRDAQRELIELSQQCHDDEKDLSHVDDDPEKYNQINQKADAADNKVREIIDTYKPMCMKAGLLLGSALYQKHEYKKNFKEAVRERNLQCMCQGTLKAMDESRQENKQLAHEALHGPHGLLR